MSNDHPVLELRFAVLVGAEHAPPLQAHGATLLHEPVMTPWGDYNVRLQDPDGMQITLFQVMNASSPS